MGRILSSMLPLSLVPPVLFGVLFGVSFGGASASAAPRFFVVVRTVDEAPGLTSGILDEAKKLFIAELGRHGELTLTPPEELGSGDGARLEGDPAAYKEALKNHNLRAVELTLRILEMGGSVEPPPAGKPFRVLKRSIKLAVFGSTLPDKIMAIGGDGDSAIASEIRKNEDEKAEGKKLIAEAAAIAIKQAVDMTVTKLNLPPPKDPKRKNPAKK